MKKIILFLAVILLAANIQGQFSGLGITGGIGTYNLSELSQYQSVLSSRLPVEVKQFSSFPAYSNFRLNLFNEQPSGFNYGITFAYSTTGSHANYTDFSGFLNLDQLITAFQFGVSAGYPLLHFDVAENRLEFLVYGDLRLGYIRDKVTMNITTNYYFESNALILNTFSPQTEIGLQSMYHMTRFSLGVEAGYLYDVGRKFDVGEQSSYSSSVSLKPTGDLSSGMSGFRIGLKMIFWFNKLMIPV